MLKLCFSCCWMVRRRGQDTAPDPDVMSASYQSRHSQPRPPHRQQSASAGIHAGKKQNKTWTQLKKGGCAVNCANRFGDFAKSFQKGKREKRQWEVILLYTSCFCVMSASWAILWINLVVQSKYFTWWNHTHTDLMTQISWVFECW